jgi:hypothetical protein
LSFVNIYVDVCPVYSLPSRLSPYVDEIIGDHQCGLRRGRSTTSHIFCIRQILEKKYEYSETVHQLFIDFKNVHDSVRREVLYNILIKSGVLMELVRLSKMCLNETYSEVCIGKYMSDNFPIYNALKTRDDLSSLFFNSALECAIRKVQENQGD